MNKINKYEMINDRLFAILSNYGKEYCKISKWGQSVCNSEVQEICNDLEDLKWKYTKDILNALIIEK